MKDTSAPSAWDTPRVSVIMNCRNGEAFLTEAIDSVYKQTRDDWEIILWDNMSKDATARIAKGYDKKLRYFLGNAPLPLGEARNKALEHARGDFVAFLDCDDVWRPEKLERQLSLFDADPELACVFTEAEVVDASGTHVRFMSDDYPPCRGMVLRDLFLLDFVPFSSAVVSREKLLKVGGFRTDLHIVEDLDLFLKLAEHWRFDYVPGPLTKYRVHRGNATANVDLCRKESVAVHAECIARHPHLRNELGRGVVRYVLTGLPCGPVEQLILRLKPASARRQVKSDSRLLKVILRTSVIYGVSWFGRRAIDAFVAAERRWRGRGPARRGASATNSD